MKVQTSTLKSNLENLNQCRTLHFEMESCIFYEFDPYDQHCCVFVAQVIITVYAVSMRRLCFTSRGHLN